MVTYQRLWETLKKRNIRKHDLMELADISSTTLTKLNKNEIVALTILIKICKALNCQIEDIVEVKDETLVGYTYAKMRNAMTDYECTLLVGRPNAPSVYSLNNRPDLAKQRQKKVIVCMVEVEYITEDEAKEILGEE